MVVHPPSAVAHLTGTSKYQDLRRQIRNLSNGQTMTIFHSEKKTGDLKKKKQGSYVLFDSDSDARSRWGNLDQIFFDAIYFCHYGSLPEAKSQ